MFAIMYVSTWWADVSSVSTSLSAQQYCHWMSLVWALQLLIRCCQPQMAAQDNVWIVSSGPKNEERLNKKTLNRLLNGWCGGSDQVNSYAALLKSLFDFTQKVQFIASWDQREEKSSPVTTTDSNMTIMRKNLQNSDWENWILSVSFQSCCSLRGPYDKIGIRGRDEFTITQI